MALRRSLELSESQPSAGLCAVSTSSDCNDGLDQDEDWLGSVQSTTEDSDRWICALQ